METPVSEEYYISSWQNHTRRTHPFISFALVSMPGQDKLSVCSLASYYCLLYHYEFLLYLTRIPLTRPDLNRTVMQSVSLQHLFPISFGIVCNSHTLQSTTCWPPEGPGSGGPWWDIHSCCFISGLHSRDNTSGQGSSFRSSSIIRRAPIITLDSSSKWQNGLFSISYGHPMYP